MQCDYRIENGKISNVGTKKMTFWLQQFKNPKYEKWKPENLDLWKGEFGKQKFWLQESDNKNAEWQLKMLNETVWQFLATLVALHFTPVSEWVGRSFGPA